MSGPIRFNYNLNKFVNAVAYFAAKRLPDLTKLKVAKLLYYVDKTHLQRYGRPVTGDAYFALQRGPVPTVSLDIMSEAIKPDETENPDVDCLRQYVGFDRKRAHPTFSSKLQPDLDVFSESEIEVLGEVVSGYGDWSAGALIEKTHSEPAWQSARLNSQIDWRLFLEELPKQEKDEMLALIEFDQEDRDFFDSI